MPSRIVKTAAYAGKEKSIRCVNIQNWTHHSRKVLQI
jgi:hypothetical protein